MSVWVVEVACWNGHEPVKVATFVEHEGTWGVRVHQAQRLPDVEPPPGGITEGWIREHATQGTPMRNKPLLHCQQCDLNARVPDVSDLAPLLHGVAASPGDHVNDGVIQKGADSIMVPLMVFNRYAHHTWPQLSDTP